MTELSTLQWFGVYLVVGACVLVLLRLYVTLVVRPQGDSEFVTEMMAAIRADEPYDWRKTAKSVLFIPLAVLVWPLSAGVGVKEIQRPSRTYREPSPEEKFRCQREHLRMLTSPTEAERLGVVIDPLGRAPALSFGHLNAGWLAFLDKQEQGFALWYFEVPHKPTGGKSTYAPSSLELRGFAWVKAEKVKAEFAFEGC
jgi:hypothetical protein